MTDKNGFHINTQKLSEIINYVYACLPPAQIILRASVQKFRDVTVVELKDTPSARTFMVPLQIKFYPDVNLCRPLSDKASYDVARPASWNRRHGIQIYRRPTAVQWH